MKCFELNLELNANEKKKERQRKTSQFITHKLQTELTL